jgi:hypothetical protein
MNDCGRIARTYQASLFQHGHLRSSIGLRSLLRLGDIHRKLMPNPRTGFAMFRQILVDRLPKIGTTRFLRAIARGEGEHAVYES